MKVFYSIVQNQWDEIDYVRFFEFGESINPTKSGIIFVSNDIDKAKQMYNSLNGTKDDMCTEYVLYRSRQYDEDYSKEIQQDIDKNDFKYLPDSMCYEDMEYKSYDVEPQKINPKAVIIKWSWKRYIGYCRELEEIDFAENLGIKTTRDLVTGNEERTFSSNLSLLLENADGYSKEELYDALYEELGNDWKWNNSYEKILQYFLDFRY